MKLNKGEKMALKILPKLGFRNVKKEKFVDFSADYKEKKALIEVKYRKKLSNSCKVTKKQLREANFFFIVNENGHKLVKKSEIKKHEITDYRIFF